LDCLLKTVSEMVAIRGYKTIQNWLYRPEWEFFFDVNADVVWWISSEAMSQAEEPDRPGSEAGGGSRNQAWAR
jgi:hypothetical protein